ncbi:hypothetical protein NDU88_007038 [Pleurodeles waltl]|uniref:Uncharacterized protein n=1 Tax=Pleurodeles waltl TaxID=8319 RepID=A0AAV7SR91_PLEWA|nr:hypothetical protein NDU88_007038 [Pleurodeles waltl]
MGGSYVRGLDRGGGTSGGGHAMNRRKLPGSYYIHCEKQHVGNESPSSHLYCRFKYFTPEAPARILMRCDSQKPRYCRRLMKRAHHERNAPRMTRVKGTLHASDLILVRSNKCR